MVTLDGHVLQDLISFVFLNPFRLLFILFLTSVHVILTTELPMNQSGNIVVPSLVLFLCQFHVSRFYHVIANHLPSVHGNTDDTRTVVPHKTVL